MRTSQEILRHTTEVIARMHQHPEKFGRTASELNVAFYQIHHFWAHITAREQELDAVHRELCMADYPPCDDLADWFEVATDTPTWNLVLKHWQNVDATLGILTG